MEHPVILFDGVCNLCNNSVQFVIKKDPKSIFRFASLQSKEAQQLLNKPLTGTPESILLLENGKVYAESTAALRIAKRLKGLWPLLYYLFIWWPGFIRNGVYRFIARNRYRWFGKQESCMIPTPERKHLFLDQQANA